MPDATTTMHLDKGLDNTVIGESTKSFIDGQQGVLEYVGIDIDDLARAVSAHHFGQRGLVLLPRCCVLVVDPGRLALPERRDLANGQVLLDNLDVRPANP